METGVDCLPVFQQVVCRRVRMAFELRAAAPREGGRNVAAGKRDLTAIQGLDERRFPTAPLQHGGYMVMLLQGRDERR